MAFIMGTAGHVDHGKTSLIKVLTGVDCDRLQEEKKRGITIELGFAALTLDDGQILSIIDVPGHEKFVKNMVSGASGIDFVLLVIAADEAIMPQTKEHLEICKLLGIKQGIVALSKIDLVDPDILDLAMQDVQEYLADTFLKDAPIIPLSSYTQNGISELIKQINALTKKIAATKQSDLFRMPIDRIFTLKGHGTVLTGTIIASSVKLQDELQVYPSQKCSRVRSLQSHNLSVNEAFASSRCAVNLANTELQEIERGNVLAKSGTLFPAKRWLVSLECLSSSPKDLQNRSEIHLHHGSKECLAKLYFYKQDKLKRGDTCLAELRFTEEMVGVFGDYCIIRSFSPLRTIAGAKILQALPNAPIINKLSLEESQRLLKLAKSESLENILLTQIELMQDQGLTEAEMLVLSANSKKNIEKALSKLENKISCFDKEQRAWISATSLDLLMQKTLENAKIFHQQEAYKAGMSRTVLINAFQNSKLGFFVLEKLLKKGELVKDAEIIRLASHKINLDASEEELQVKIIQIYEAADLSVPNIAEVEEMLNITNIKDLNNILKILLAQTRLVKISDKLYCSSLALNKLKSKMLDYFKLNTSLDQASFKELSGNLSRKYTIAYLEYFDREKITVRVGDLRQLRKSSLTNKP